MIKQQSLDLGDEPDKTRKALDEVYSALSNSDTQKRLKYLSEELAKLRASDAKPREIKSQRKRAHRPGWIQKAVIEVMSKQTGPIRATDVHKLVEELVGEKVSKNSVNDALASKSKGTNPLFVRITRGRYVYLKV